MKKKLRPGSSMADVKIGLEALSAFWKAGYRPDDLERHYFFTWFADSDGRILVAIRKMGIHRSTFQNYMEKMGLSGRTIKLRKVWQGLDD
jgi:DNA-binding NtrC family response regulator